ncbi:little elongation complex subunit 2-like [Saccostrea echinata]|uniref:little elongation complex subunit 2-like n=1 Tax=Saccostrea echinata TaxID=191078 RepID=UPI002A840214|nr:little elongation complex subunit 2-like [Saccostrea echinata]
MADYESVLCVKNNVHVYRIPPRPSNRGYRASDWKLDAPDWDGRLRVVAKGKDLFIKLEDKTSGELFAQCPVDSHPGTAVESVMDSSRYFVIRIKDDNGRSAFIGIGFDDRSDSFDLNVALQDHFKWLKKEEEAQAATKEFDSGPKLDLGFKAGQTITINVAKTKKVGSDTTTSKPRPKGGTTGGMLPPPPGGMKLPPPPGGALQQTFPAPPSGNVSQAQVNKNSGSNVDLLDFDFGESPSSTSSNTAPIQPVQTKSDPWGDFTGAGNKEPINGIDCFFTEESFNKYSRIPPTLEERLLMRIKQVKGEPVYPSTAQVKSCSAETSFSIDEREKITESSDNAGEFQPKQTEKTFTKTQSTPAKEQQKKKICSELPYSKKVAPPRKSRFSHDQQKRYVYLYKKYTHRTSIDTTPEERGEIRELQILTSEVLEEQREFQEFQEMLSNTAHKTDYTYMNPAARKYMEDYVHSRKKEAELYPKYYNTESSFNIDGEGQPSRMMFIKPLLQLGIVPKMILPTVTQQLKPELPLDSLAVSQQYPVSKSRNHKPGAWNHEPCSLDDNATHLAVENRAHIVISAGALQCLVDNHAPKHLEEWEMPFIVREYQLKDGDEVFVQRVVFIDRPFLQPQLTPKDKNTKYFKYALKAFIAKPSQKGHVFSKIDNSGADAKFVGPSSHVNQQTTNTNYTACSKKTSVKKEGQDVTKKREEPFSVGDISLEDLECFGTTKKKKNTTAKNKQTPAVDMEIESQVSIDDLESFGTVSANKIQKTAEKIKSNDSDQDLIRKIKEMHKPQKQILPTKTLAKEKPALDLANVNTNSVGNSSKVQEIHMESGFQSAENVENTKDAGNVPEKNEHSQPDSYNTHVKDSSVENMKMNSENENSQMPEQNIESSLIVKAPQMIPWRTPELFDESDQKTTSRESEKKQTRQAAIHSEEDSSDDEDKLFIIESPTKKMEVFDEAPASPSPASPDPGQEETEICRIIPIGSDYTPDSAQSPAWRQESPTSPVKGGHSDISETMQCPLIPLCGESEDEIVDTSCQDQISKQISHFPDSIFEKPVGTPLRRSGRCRKNSRSLDSLNTESGQTAQNTSKMGDCFSDTFQSCESDVHHEGDDNSKQKVMTRKKKCKKDITSESENEEKEVKHPTAQPVKRKRGRPRKNPSPESLKAEGNESEKGQASTPLRMSTRSRSRSSVGGTSEDEVQEKEVANRSRRKRKSEAGGSKESEKEVEKPAEDGNKTITGLETKKDKLNMRDRSETSAAGLPVQAKRPRSDNAENLLGNIGPHKRVSRVGRQPSTPAHSVTKPESNQLQQVSEVKSRESKKTNQQTHKAEDKFSLDSILNVQQTLLKSGEVLKLSMPSFTAENVNHVFKFPQRNNVTYNLWDLGGFKIVVRCNIHGVIRDMNQQLSFIHLMPKLEYQCQFGMEQVTPSEAVRTWISSYIRPNCRVLRARFHTQRTELFSVEELQAAQIVPPSQNFNPGNGFLMLQNIFHHLHQLSPGQYLLSHKKSSDKCVIKKATEDNKRGSYDLHFNQLGFADPEFDKRKVQWTPLDPTIMLPYHTMNGRIPVTFDPPDFKFTYSAQNKTTKRKKKNKGKRKKDKNKNSV